MTIALTLGSTTPSPLGWLISLFGGGGGTPAPPPPPPPPPPVDDTASQEEAARERTRLRQRRGRTASILAGRDSGGGELGSGDTGKRTVLGGY